MPKDEATAALQPEIRAFLDNVLRLYREPGLFADRKETLALFGMEVGEHDSFAPSTGREHLPQRFRDRLTGGIVVRPGWKATYQCCSYPRSSDPVNYRWVNDLTFNIDRKQECIDSRAVEGYLDLYLHPYVLLGPDPTPPDEWYRHGRAGGGANAEQLSSKTPALYLGFNAGCLVTLDIGGHFLQKEYSNDRIYN